MGKHPTPTRDTAPSAEARRARSPRVARTVADRREYFGGAYQPWGGAPAPAPVPPKTNGFAIASLSCGIASLVICCAFSGAISLVLGILGIVFAGVSRRGEPMTGMAKAGMICGIVALVFSVLAILLSTVFYAALEELIGEMESGYGEYAARVLSHFKGWLK